MAELTGPANLEPMIRAACVQVESAGIETIVISSGNSQQSELNAWDILARSNCDGYIVYSETLSNDQLARIKSVRSNMILPNIDYTLAGKLSANLLAKLGHTDIAMVAGPQQRFSARSKGDGFIEHLNLMASQTVRVETIHMDEISVQAGRQAMQRFLKADPLPTALFSHHENFATGAMQICKEQQVKVPDELSLLTCSEGDISYPGEPQLCMVRQPMQAIGRFAAQRLIALINQQADTNYTAATTWPAPYIELHDTLKDRNSTSQNLQSTKSPTLQERISERERECLQWASQGKTSWEISQILGVTESTIIYHLRNATRKLNAANRLHAVTKALKASIIEF